MGGAFYSILAFVAFAFAIVVHESAHGLAAERLGDSTARRLGRITLNPLPHVDPVGTVLLPILAAVSGVPVIGWARPVPVDTRNLAHPVRDHALIAAAGPASNLVLGVLASLAWVAAGAIFSATGANADDASVQFFNVLFAQLITVNCILAVFNLLPIPPLDGHWIALHLLPAGARERFLALGRWGFLVLLALLWTGALWWIVGPPFRVVRSAMFALVQAGIRLVT